MTKRNKGDDGAGDAPLQPDTGAPPALPRSITRRAFVKTSSGIFVAAGFPVACTRNGVVSPGAAGGQGVQQAAPVTGSIEAIVSGVDSSASDGGTVKISAVAPTQNVKGVTPLTKTLPTSGDSGVIPGIPIGTYRASYTPPSNQALAPNQVNPQSKDVTADALTQVTWTVVAANGSIRVAVTGLATGAPDGGSASVLRTDISGQSPVTVTVAGDGTAPDLGVTAGTYSVTYTPPVSYAINTGVQNPQDLTVASGGVQSASFAVTQTTTFQTPDVINNASFENGWAPLINPSGGGVPTSGTTVTIERTTEQAYDGQTSVKIAFQPNPNNNGVHCAADFGGSFSHFWVRFYFLWTAVPEGQTKWARFQVGGFNANDGLYTYGDGYGKGILWSFPESTPGAVFHEIGADFTLNAWHSIEYEADRANGRIRFWYDGSATVPVPYHNSSVTTDGTWLILGLAQKAVTYMTWMNVINYVKSVSGACYFDRLAVSTLGRIGP